SYNMHEKSRASFITGETAVLTIAADISCVKCCKRFRRTSTVTGSTRSATRHLQHEIPERLHARAVAGPEENRRVAALDERRAAERHAGGELLAVVDRDTSHGAAAGKPRRARRSPRRLGIRGSERRRRRRCALAAP